MSGLVAWEVYRHGASRSLGPVLERKSKMQGTVKFFNSEKGFGFISRDCAQMFLINIHDTFDSINPSLDEGQLVEFDVAPGRKGEEAQNVRAV